MKVRITEDGLVWTDVEVEVDDFDQQYLFFVGYNAVKKTHPELTPDNHCAKIEINRQVDDKFINVVEIFDTDTNPMMIFTYETVE